MSVGIAVLGTGRIVETGYVPAFAAADNADLVAVLSREQARADAYAAKHGIPGAYADLGALLADPAVEAVIVASPDSVHEEQVIAAARAGKHILCEKPMGTTSEACARMAEAVRASGVKFQMGYDHRFLAGQRRIKELIDTGAIGPVRYAHAYVTTHVSDPASWRAAGEESAYWAMSATGTHVIDIYRWFFGEPERVGGGFSAPVHHTAKDEIAILVMDYPGRLMAEMTVASVLPHASRLEIHGEKGSIMAENVFGRVDMEAKIVCNGKRETIMQVDPFIDEVRDFADAIEQDREPSITLEDGLRNLHIMEVADRGPLLLPL